nr:MAG TPA: hypothetical protein [Caudoviricetes sp.]
MLILLSSLKSPNFSRFLLPCDAVYGIIKARQ